MLAEAKEQIKIDLDQFKLHIRIEQRMELSLHFDSPSRRFYLSVIALVVDQMKRLDRIAPISLEAHLDELALLNETVGSSAGSSKKENLLPRIYKKWKGALPDIENAPLFRIPAKKKEYEDTIEKTYRFSEEVKDAWANLFDYKGSEEKVRLRFSIDRIGVNLDDVTITYGEELNLRNTEAWDKFIDDLRQKEIDRPKPDSASIDLKGTKSGPHIKREIIKKPWHRIALAGAIILIIGIAITTVWKSYWFSSPAIEPASLDKMAFPLPEEPSIAVLPFQNLSGDPSYEYLADSITDNIITALSQVPKMFVIARNSVLTYKEKPVKVRKVSEELGVRYVLEGSVQREKERLRINVQLIDAIRGNHLWAKGYDRELKDLFALQDEITIKVLTALRTKLTKGELERIYARGTENLEAYFKAMKALEHLLRFTKDDNRLAQQTAREIITIDPTWPNGYILLGWTHFMDARGGYRNSPEVSLSRAEELARKALELDGSLSTPHLILGKIHYMRRHWDKAIAEMELALSLAPNNIEVIYHYARTLVYAGRPEESIPLYKKAMRLDPLYFALVNWGLGTAYFDSGRYEDAHLQFERLLDRSRKGEYKPESAHILLAATCAMLDRMEEAQGHIKEVFKINPKFSHKLYINRHPYKKQVDKNRWLDALRKAGLPE